MSSLPTVPSGSAEPASNELYFAYGSNMHLAQMAARCPDSTLYGTGILRKYRWSTNSRGGGNVVEGSNEDFVGGVIFTVSPSNVQALRHYEGVAQETFVERSFDVEVERALDEALKDQRPADAAKLLAQHDLVATERHTGGAKVVRKALVYISYKYQSPPGAIRVEYIGRMHLAMADARKLGVSRSYLDDALLPEISGKQAGADVNSIQAQ